jgi:hypothetical protein
MTLFYLVAATQSGQQTRQERDAPGQVADQYMLVQRMGSVALRPETV